MTPAELKAFFSTRRVLIAMSGQGAARAIRKLVMQMGAKPDAVFIAETFQQAKNELEGTPTDVLFADAALKDPGGLPLVPIQEKAFSGRLEIVSILVSGEPSQSTLGAITDSNIDAVLIQPFTVKSFNEAVEQALKTKLNPSPYLKMLEQGKITLKSSKIDDALAIFEESLGLDASPSLSHYYIGQVRTQKEQYPKAIESFQAGLALDPKHFNCLSGLFQMFMKSAEYPKAYELAKRIHADYPVSPERILDLVKLSVYVRKFEDVVDYYQIFKQAPVQDAMLSKVVVAGMLICAKYYYIHDKKKECLEVMKSASRSALERKVLELDVFRYFIETSQYGEAEVYYSSMPDELQAEPRGKLLYFDLIVGMGDRDLVLKEGLKLVKEKNTSLKLFQVLIKAVRADGKSKGTLDALIADAMRLYPEQVDTFNE